MDVINWLLCEENVIFMCVYIYDGLLLRHEKEWNSDICNEMNATGDHYVTWNKADTGRLISHFLSYVDINIKSKSYVNIIF